LFELKYMLSMKTTALSHNSGHFFCERYMRI